LPSEIYIILCSWIHVFFPCPRRIFAHESTLIHLNTYIYYSINRFLSTLLINTYITVYMQSHYIGPRSFLATLWLFAYKKSPLT
jgi:hypothetical protein